MIRRALSIGNYNTALDGKFVTAEMEIGQPEFYEEFQEVPGMHGALDFSEAPVDHPVYKMREISVAFESSRGSVQEREERITEFMAACHGQRLKIVLPVYRTSSTSTTVFPSTAVFKGGCPTVCIFSLSSRKGETSSSSTATSTP